MKKFCIRVFHEEIIEAEAEVQALMNLIITKNVVNTKNGALTSIVDGGIVTRSFTDLVP